MKQRTNYGNWVPATILRISYGCAVAFLLLFFFSAFCWHNFWAAVIAGLLALAAIVIAVFMQVCHHTFSFNGGGLMGEIHQFLIDHLDWDGHGTLLDIGCGAGALTNRCAKQFPEATLQGMDYWGMGWDYAKEQCERNAEIEGVADRVTFSKGDASKLDFADESFDAAVSNFVFHEVKTQPDKREVVREALRVVKKGGAFAFQDLFGSKALYGDMDAFVEELRREGIAEIHCMLHVEKQDFIKRHPLMCLMLQNMGLIYGIK
ncbi:Methyltransferase domain-containing protein [Segatella oulorum]|uniref:Methyltransferase domain-containing protein n=1 Tax=Segatella oulorum TaxID=28136 RepID=A0A1T4M855_9BACT|nr:class I SAM-dependent methyltransferase [Segatella oulorum]SJZ63027.1 Methyltransferase domain-containing protein [Segatella oulorum]